MRPQDRLESRREENAPSVADDRYVCSTELEDEDGNPYRVCQQAVGAPAVMGGGEFPEPDAPATAPAPGAVAPDHGDDYATTSNGERQLVGPDRAGEAGRAGDGEADPAAAQRRRDQADQFAVGRGGGGSEPDRGDQRG